jgi:hypothetical protein
MKLAPGPNDISLLSPGVYFVQRNAGGGGRKAVTRILLVR